MRLRAFDRILLYLTIAAIVIISIPGPDFPHYYDWAQAALAGDIAQLNSYTTSPTGVPLSQWSHGAGFFISFGQWLGAGWLGPEESIRITCAISNSIFWIAAAGILQIAARGRIGYILFGLALLAFGTNAGYYCRSIGSETFALMNAAILVYCAAWKGPAGLLQMLIHGCALGFLMISRPQFAPLAVALTAIAAFRARADRRVFWGYAVICIIGAAWGILQLATVNYWMTGDVLQNPYSFGDEEYSSFSLSRAHFWEVLFHPANGWFIYHPVAILGFAALLWCIWTPPDLYQKMAFIAVGAAVGIQIIISASWCNWWLGESFGMRGFSVIFLVFIPAIVRWIADAAPAAARIIIFLATACGVYSAFLLFKEAYFYVTWTEILQFEKKIFTTAAVIIPFVASALVAVGLWRRGGGAGSRDGDLDNDNAAQCAGVIVASAGFQFLFDFLSRRFGMQHWPSVELNVATRVVASLLLTFWLWGLGRGTVAEPAAGEFLQKHAYSRFIAVATGILFIFITVVFARLAWNTNCKMKEFAASGASLDRKRATSSVDLGEVRATLDAYNRIPGYNSDAGEVRRFIAREEARRGIVK